MRDIKFRGKRCDNGEWIYGYYVQGASNGSNRILHHGIAKRGYYPFAVFEPTVGQYIETVKDVEIYTGDIIKAYKRGDLETKPIENEISYRNGTYWFGNWTFLEFMNVFRSIEKTGTIHDCKECE